MSMAETISENVSEDERNGIMAVWHDESHLNHYVNVNHPEFMFLPLHYCCPDTLTLTPEPAKIIALTKTMRRCEVLEPVEIDITKLPVYWINLDEATERKKIWRLCLKTWF